MSYFSATKLVDEAGVPYGVKQVENKPRVSSMPYLYDIGEGNIAGHVAWSKIGYIIMPATVESDVWSYGATTNIVPIMTAGATRRIVTANAADAGAVIKGDATGDTITSDAGGSTTTLVDADVDFLAATAVAIGDCVILDPHGAVAEWGFVTGVATNTLILANGFSQGGTGSLRKYAVVDYSPQVGCHAVLINYLDSNYATKKEIVVTNGNQANGVVTIGSDIFRVNSFRVIATGSAGKPTGDIKLGDNATPPTIIYAYITAGFTRSRGSLYTVPADKTLYLTSWTMSYAAAVDNRTTSCRFYTRAAQFTAEDITYRTNVAPGVMIWYPYAEVVVSNSVAVVGFDVPIKILPKVSVKVSGSGASIATGIATSVLRGWLE